MEKRPPWPPHLYLPGAARRGNRSMRWLTPSPTVGGVGGAGGPVATIRGTIFRLCKGIPYSMTACSTESLVSVDRAGWDATHGQASNRGKSGPTSSGGDVVSARRLEFVVARPERGHGSTGWAVRPGRPVRSWRQTPNRRLPDDALSRGAGLWRLGAPDGGRPGLGCAARDWAAAIVWPQSPGRQGHGHRPGPARACPEQARLFPSGHASHMAV